MILIIDNFDSFTFNLVQYIGEINPDLKVVRNNAITVAEALTLKPTHIVVSPGPCTPSEAGISVDLIRQVPPSIPLLGVCLGHQAMGEAFGGKVIRAPTPMHGKLSVMECDCQDLFAGVPKNFSATRYHSLIVEKSSLPGNLRITATCLDNTGPVRADQNEAAMKPAASGSAEGQAVGKPTPGDGTLIMAMRHKARPIFGVQFHPESILTEHGKVIIRNFLSMKGI
ncbi:MAG: aminodeoxychorismate/anthranilate synthase component II [Fibrobacterota bacterium]|nr:aminodeoxychorismate/anthranilate synthase component II [Fibrobacterota bacterium]